MQNAARLWAWLKGRNFSCKNFCTVKCVGGWGEGRGRDNMGIGGKRVIK